jgi:hypothetical protein
MHGRDGRVRERQDRLVRFASDWMGPGSAKRLGFVQDGAHHLLSRRVTAASFYEIDEWVVDDRSGRHVFTGETDTITDLADGFRGTGLGRAVPRPPAGGLFLAAWGLTRYKGLGWRLDADAGGAEYHVPIRTARRRPASTELYLRETASRAGSVQLVRATSSRHAATPLKPSVKKGDETPPSPELRAIARK